MFPYENRLWYWNFCVKLLTYIYWVCIKIYCNLFQKLCNPHDSFLPSLHQCILSTYSNMVIYWVWKLDNLCCVTWCMYTDELLFGLTWEIIPTFHPLHHVQAVVIHVFHKLLLINSLCHPFQNWKVGFPHTKMNSLVIYLLKLLFRFNWLPHKEMPFLHHEQVMDL